MTVLYLADIRLPLERANGIQTMETCHALATRGQRVSVPVRGRPVLRRAHYLAAALATAVSRRDIDAVFTRDLGLASLLLRWPRGARPPLVYESHGYAPVVSGLLPELLSTAPKASRAKAARLAARERRVWAGAEGYVTITRALAQDLRSRLGPRPRGDSIAPLNGDDVSRSNADTNAMAATDIDVSSGVAVVPDGVRLAADRRFEWTGPSASPVAVYAGHLYPWKGVDTFIAALAHAPGLRARIIGGHPAEPDLARVQTHARAAGVMDRVEFMGLQPPPAVAALLSSADLLILPNRTSSVSAHYTSPLKLFEYLAAGRPIVASDLPALREVLRHGENGWLTPPDDAVALAAGMRRVLADPTLAVRLAHTAFEDASQYSWARRAERLEEVIACAVADGTRSRERS
jgi:glycosyltransferase involved in cell wall biosynthesis